MVMRYFIKLELKAFVYYINAVKIDMKDRKKKKTAFRVATSMHIGILNQELVCNL